MAIVLRFYREHWSEIKARLLVSCWIFAYVYVYAADVVTDQRAPDIKKKMVRDHEGAMMK